MTKDQSHIEAVIIFLRTEEGGRIHPVFSGYRPQFYYDGQDWDAVQSYPGVERVNPGDTVVARLTFLSPQSHRGKVHPGMAFEVREGMRVIGHGVVKKVFDF